MSIAINITAFYYRQVDKSYHEHEINERERREESEGGGTKRRKENKEAKKTKKKIKNNFSLLRKVWGKNRKRN